MPSSWHGWRVLGAAGAAADDPALGRQQQQDAGDHALAALVRLALGNHHLLGEAGVNIGTFHLGRREAGGEAVLLLSVDQDVTPDLVTQVRALAGVRTAVALRF